MDVQFAETAAEGEMLLRRELLIAEEDDEVFGQRAMNLVHLPVGAGIVIDESCDIDAGDLRTNDRCQFVDADGLIRCSIVRGVLVARPLLACERAHARSPSMLD